MASESSDDEPKRPPRTPIAQPREPIDPGAVLFMRLFLRSVPEPIQGEDGVTRISIHTLLNQSRSTRDEFRDMLLFMMDHLNRAGRTHRVVFTDAEEAIVQYRLDGAAYRKKVNDRNQWELFLRIQQDEDGSLVWEVPGSLLVMLYEDLNSPALRITQ